jgi:phosphatidylglycerol lysyltransferase
LAKVYGLGFWIGLLVWERFEVLAQTPRVLLTQWATAAIPKLFSLAIFAGGCFLLISIFRPVNAELLPFIKHMLPLEVVEASHVLGTVIGVLMIFLARGLWERIDGAWYAAIATFLIGALLSITREFDLLATIIFIICALFLMPCKPAFYRRSNLLQLKPSPVWTCISLLSLGGIIWLGFYIYSHVPYAHDLWSRFAYEGNVSRFLRALVFLGVVILILSLLRLFAIAKPLPELPDAEELDLLKKAMPQINTPAAWLALTGDKHILWGDDHQSFLMYGISGNNWIVLGDPIGTEAEQSSLSWRLKEMANAVKAKLSFYQVSPKTLPLMIELGLSLYKIGEEAMIEVALFELSGKKGYGFRQTLKRFETLGAQFEIISKDALKDTISELKSVSDNWLKSKNAREMAYSLGSFDEAYLELTPVAVVRIEGKIIAFTNLWPTANRSCMAIDMMRYQSESPSGVMEFLFLKLIEYCQNARITHFSLGLAPLSGFEAQALSPFWTKLGTLIYSLGREFYNFEGLRGYKNKFHPNWQPRYLAVSGRETALIPALMALNALNHKPL